MNLVTADREQVNSKFFRADTVFSVCLDRIYMNDRIGISLIICLKMPMWLVHRDPDSDRAVRDISD